MKPELTIQHLLNEAKLFCELFSKQNHKELIGVTDGKAVGTYVEHRFSAHLLNKYRLDVGNSAKGIDLPGANINTDIKVTSCKQPQSSCPYKSPDQKIFGLGYNLLVMVYQKNDSPRKCQLQFTNCTFIDAAHTGDYTLTKRLTEMVRDGANKDDIIGLLVDRGLPGDDITLDNLATQILRAPIVQGYLTISNALQWRLQYQHVLELHNSVNGITNHEW